MKKLLFVSLALAGLFAIPPSRRAQFAGSVVAYTEGGGVLPGYTDPNGCARCSVNQTIDNPVYAAIPG